MLLVLLRQQPCKQLPILFIAIWLPLPPFPFVISGFTYAHDLTEKFNRILRSERFDDFVLLSCMVMYSLLAPTPSTQYPFLTVHFPVFVLRYGHPDAYVQFLISASVSTLALFGLFAPLPPRPIFYYKEKVDNMVVFQVSTFILQLQFQSKYGGFVVRVVIQNFLKKPVISTVFKADE